MKKVPKKDVDLKNKPLVEAWVEVQWDIGMGERGVPGDRNYKLLLGRLFNSITTKYPEYEALPAASVPDGVLGHVVQHRFRTGKDGWPVVQVGLGVFTFNETEGYSWKTFRQESTWAIQQLFKSYPTKDFPRITSIALKYRDALLYDPEAEDILGFLAEKLKLNASFPEALFDGLPVNKAPQVLNLITSFDTTAPKGNLQLLFASGVKRTDGGERPAVIWETTVRSENEDAPRLPQGLSQWIDRAHAITHGVFFKLIEGDLRREFENE